MRRVFLSIFLLLSVSSYAQNINIVFGPDVYLYYVKNFHPIAKQSQLILDNAKANLLSARGGFDPKLYSSLDEKNFDDKNYYSFLDAGLKVPTWYGLEFNAGFQQNAGVNLNPENLVPYNGLAQVGFSANLLQGLYIDERRTALKKAKLFNQYSIYDQQSLLNELILDAMQAYWNWVSAYHQLNIQTQAADLALVRFQNIRSSYQLGDNPAIDTLESYIQYQNRFYAKIEAEQNLRDKRLMLSTFLWYEDNKPLELSDSVKAPEINNQKLLSMVDSIINTAIQINDEHPLIKQYEFKLKDLELDRKLNAERLKPNLDFKYNFLNEPVNSIPWDGLNSQNIKWGLSFSYPLLLRKERGNLQKTKIKIKENTWLRDLKRYDLQNKSNSIQQELINTQRQLNLYTSVVENNRRMLDAEINKFNNGESSVFLINSREITLIQSQLSLINLTAKYHQLYVKKRWILGNLFN